MDVKRYFGDRAFYKAALAVALPIMAQNTVTNLVNMLDNLMVGSLGTESVSGVAIINQILLIYALGLFGAMSGIGIFTVQYHGKGDTAGVRHTLRFKLFVALGFFAVAAAVLLLFDDALVGLFLHSSAEGGDLEATLAIAKLYLRVMLWGLLPMAVTQALADTLRETGDTFTPMLVGLAAVLVNCLFNFLLIFGKLGFPALGVRGAAIATVFSRWVEASALTVYLAARRERFPYVKGLFRSLRVPGELAADIFRRGTPLMFNEILWSAGMSAQGVAFSLHGLNVVAAYSISSTVYHLFCIAAMGMGSALGILAGQSLGAGKTEEAVDRVRKLVTFSTLMGVAFAALLFCVGGVVPQWYNVEQPVRDLAAFFIRVNAFILPLHAFTNACYFTVRSGGKTLITFFFDSGVLWACIVPAAFALYYVFHLEIHWLYPLVQAVELVKVFVGWLLVKKRVWVRTIV